MVWGCEYEFRVVTATRFDSWKLSRKIYSQLLSYVRVITSVFVTSWYQDFRKPWQALARVFQPPVHECTVRHAHAEEEPQDLIERTSVLPPFQLIRQSRSLCHSSPTNRNDLPVHPRAILTTQKGNDAADIARQPNPAQHAKLARHLLDLLVRPALAAGDVPPRVLGVHVRLDAPGRDAVDTDAPVAHVLRQAAHERLHRGLAARVQRVVLDRLGLRRDGREHDQPPARGEVLVGLLGDEQLAAGVDSEDAVEFVGRDLGDWGEFSRLAWR